MVNSAYLTTLRESLKVVGYWDLFLPVFIALVAFGINYVEPAFDALFLALIFGIFLGSFYPHSEKKAIIEKSLIISLPIGITLYGANVNFANLNIFPPDVVLITLALAALMGITILFLSGVMRVNPKLAILLACGTSICGVSAIAIISPLIRPNKHEFSAAIIIISVVGLTGALLYPTLGYILSLPPSMYAVLSGSTLHQTGLVKIASSPFGEEVVAEALAVKGIRIAMIAVVALLVSIIYSDHRFYVPWYIATFLAVALISGMYLPENVTATLKPLSTLAFAITLATIGFTVNIREVQKVRLTPLILAYAGWLVAILAFLAAALLGVIVV